MHVLPYKHSSKIGLKSFDALKWQYNTEKAEYMKLSPVCRIYDANKFVSKQANMRKLKHLYTFSIFWK